MKLSTAARSSACRPNTWAPPTISSAQSAASRFSALCRSITSRCRLSPPPSATPVSLATRAISMSLAASSSPEVRIAASRVVMVFALGRLAGGHRAQHRRRVVVDFLHQSGEIGRGDPAVAGQMGAADQGCERGRRDAGGAAFDLQIGCRMIGLARVMRGRLQRAHAHLDPVVGGEAFRDQRRQQNVGLSELLDDLRFHGHTRREIDLAPVCSALTTASLR